MFSEKINLLRQKYNLSQEKFAEKLNVSRQAVQRWENSTTYPDIDNMINIAKCFDVSLDWLMDLPDKRPTESLRRQEGPVPLYERLGIWESYAPDLMVDYIQALDEGRDVANLRDLVEAASKMPNGKEKEQIADTLYYMMLRAPARPDYPYREPDDLASIRLLRANPADLSEKALPDSDTLRDKLTGAWRGRICGCMLGQPIECIKTNELYPLLQRSGNWPLHRYIVSSDVADPFYDSFDFPLKSRTYPDQLKTGFPGDDDTNYTIMAGFIVDQYGRDFTSDDVCSWWKVNQTMYCYCTAEKVTYRNAIAGYFPPDTALYKNPYREWIGAQIRGDYFGYINPGDPETAADMAWRDARISHVKNGIYGEIYVAAMIAGAAVLDTPAEIVRCGMSQIPATSRLYERLNAVCEWYEAGKSYDDLVDEWHKRYDEFKPHDAVHTISNAEIVTAALLYGEGDYSRSICLSVQPGYDTDCNGATVGSVIGMLHGTACIGREWTDPIGDQVNVFFKHPAIKTDEFVNMMLRHIELKDKN